MDVDERPDEPKPERRIDAFRRTHLANERTYLAWLRSGLTSVAVGLGVAKIIPDLADAGTTWPYVALGTGFCLLGILMIAVGIQRMRRVTRALDHGEFGPLDERAAVLLGSLTIALGLATMVIIAFGH
jgi:putative membrane protein